LECPVRFLLLVVPVLLEYPVRFLLLVVPVLLDCPVRFLLLTEPEFFLEELDVVLLELLLL